MNLVRKSGIVLALLASVYAASTAHAGTLTADLKTVAQGAVYPLTSNLTISFQKDDGSWDTASNALVGRINWTNVSVPGDQGVVFSPSDPGYGLFATGQDFYSFCIEGTQNVWAPGTAHWSVVNLQNAPGPNNPSANIIGGMGAQKVSWLTEFWSENISSIVDDASAAAFQLGVWSIVYNAPTTNNTNYFALSNVHKFDSTFGNAFRILDQSLTYNSGTNTVSSSDAAVKKAAEMLAKVDGSFTPGYSLLGLTDPYFQDQVVGFPLPPTVGGEATPVPLPAALPTGLSMLSGLAVVGKLRKKRVAK